MWCWSDRLLKFTIKIKSSRTCPFGSSLFFATNEGEDRTRTNEWFDKRVCSCTDKLKLQTLRFQAIVWIKSSVIFVVVLIVLIYISIINCIEDCSECRCFLICICANSIISINSNGSWCADVEWRFSNRSIILTFTYTKVRELIVVEGDTLCSTIEVTKRSRSNFAEDCLVNNFTMYGEETTNSNTNNDGDGGTIESEELTNSVVVTLTKLLNEFTFKVEECSIVLSRYECNCFSGSRYGRQVASTNPISRSAEGCVTSEFNKVTLRGELRQNVYLTSTKKSEVSVLLITNKVSNSWSLSRTMKSTKSEGKSCCGRSKSTEVFLLPRIVNLIVTYITVVFSNGDCVSDVSIINRLNIDNRRQVVCKCSSVNLFVVEGEDSINLIEDDLIECSTLYQDVLFTLTNFTTYCFEGGSALDREEFSRSFIKNSSRISSTGESKERSTTESIGIEVPTTVCLIVHPDLDARRTINIDPTITIVLGNGVVDCSTNQSRLLIANRSVVITLDKALCCTTTEWHSAMYLGGSFWREESSVLNIREVPTRNILKSCD